jgi:hypothetical protein
MYKRKSARKLILWWATSLIFVLLGASCQSEEDREAREWMLGKPRNSVDIGEALDSVRWRTVLRSEESVADTMLQAVSFVLLTEKQATELAGEFPPQVTTVAKPFLIRAIGCHLGTCEFSVRTNKNGDVIASGHAMSHYRVTPERRPIVVWLDQPPHEVYLSFRVAA